MLCVIVNVADMSYLYMMQNVIAHINKNMSGMSLAEQRRVGWSTTLFYSLNSAIRVR